MISEIAISWVISSDIPRFFIDKFVREILIYEITTFVNKKIHKKIHTQKNTSRANGEGPRKGICSVSTFESLGVQLQSLLMSCAAGVRMLFVIARMWGRLRPGKRNPMGWAEGSR